MEQYIFLVKINPKLYYNWKENRKFDLNDYIPAIKAVLYDRGGFSMSNVDFAKPVYDIFKLMQRMNDSKGDVDKAFTSIHHAMTNGFKTFKKIYAAIDSDSQFVFIFTLFDFGLINQYVTQAVETNEHIYDDYNATVARIKITGDPEEQEDMSYWDYHILCTGDYKMLCQDLKLALDDFISNEVFEPAPQETPQETPNDVKTTSWFGNPFLQGSDWKTIEFPPPKVGDITYKISVPAGDWMSIEHLTNK